MTAVKNIPITGLISGGLKFNSVSTPPTVMAGVINTIKPLVGNTNVDTGSKWYGYVL